MKLTASQRERLLKVANKLDKLANDEEDVKTLLNAKKISKERAASLLKRIEASAKKVAQVIENSDIDLDINVDDFSDEFQDDFIDDDFGNTDLTDFSTDDFTTSDIEVSPMNDDFDFDDDFDNEVLTASASEKTAKSLTASDRQFLLKVADRFEALGNRQEEINNAFKAKKISKTIYHDEMTKVSQCLRKISSEVKARDLDLDIKF